METSFRLELGKKGVDSEVVEFDLSLGDGDG